MDASQPVPPSAAWRAWLPSRGSAILALLLLVVMLVIGQRAGAFRAEAPQVASTAAIPYQGRLADSGGSPLNGPYALTFKLYSLPSGGSALWTETWSGGNSVQVEDGLFSVMLGSLTPLSSTLTSTHDTLWLGVTVGGDAEMTPRVQLGSAPYAFTVPDGSITLDKIANDASEPTRIQTWFDNSDYSFNAAGGSAVQITMTTGITLTVPAGRAYYYWISYNAALRYWWGERQGSQTTYFADWRIDVLANSTKVGEELQVVHTPYRQDWGAVGGSSYWVIPMDATWVIRLPEGTHNLKLRIIGYSDSTMTLGHAFRNLVQVVRLP